MSVTLGQIYHAYTIGRVRFIVTDLRSGRTPNDAVDNASKTMLGTTQKQWFKDEVATAQTNGQLIVWVCTVPWIAPVGDNNGDNWGGYTTERTELTTYFAGLGVQTQMLIVCGDQHAAAIDDGTHASGGFRLMLPFPENQSTQVYGGTYSQGPISHGATRLMGYGGVLQFTDINTGILVNMSVVDETGVQLSQQVYYPLGGGDLAPAGELWYSLHPLQYASYSSGVNFTCVVDENFPVLLSETTPIILPPDSGYTAPP